MAETPEEALPLVDAHVHLWGIGDSDSGIWVSRRYRYSLKFLGGGLLAGMHRRKESYDTYFLKLLLAALRDSPIDRAVVQGMAGVYDADGRLDRARTAIHIPNEYVYRVCREHPELLPAAAINPARADWQAELERAAEAGAVYVKLNPCTGGFDPAEKRWLPLYRKVRELGLPLVCHTGPEHALPSCGHHLGDTARLELPLSEGLTVIAAHAGTGRIADGTRPFDEMIGLMERFDNLLADSSAVAQCIRWRWLKRIAGNDLVCSRLLHGSDYPVPVTTLPWGALDVRTWWRLRRIKSPLARDLAVKDAAGCGREAARRAARVLEIGPVPETS